MSEPSYETTIALARAQVQGYRLDSSFRDLEASLARSATTRTRRRRVTGVATFCVVVTWLVSVVWPQIGSACAEVGRHEIVALGLIPMIALVLSQHLYARRHVAAQVFARATWLSLVLLAFAGSASILAVLPLAFPAVLLGGGVCLLATPPPETCVPHVGGRFIPTSYRTLLTTVLVLGLADAQTLLVVSHSHQWSSVAAVVCGLGLAASAIGLYALRGWAVALNVVISAAVLAFAVFGDFVGHVLSFGLAASAVTRIGLLAVVAIAVVSKRAVSHDGVEWMIERMRRPIVVVIVAVGLSFGVRSSDASVDKECRFFRSQHGDVSLK